MNILVLGAGGFIGGHLAKRLKEEGNWVRAVDIKRHEYFKEEEFCDEFIQGDLRDPLFVSNIMFSPKQTTLKNTINPFDEVYQLAADMGGAGYVFTGDNDADIIHNSALININVAKEAVLKGVKRLFYSSSACAYPEYNQLDPLNPDCKESTCYPAQPDSEYGWEKIFSERLYHAFMKNYNLQVRIARFHNIFGPYGTYKGGKEKAPAAICRKVNETLNKGTIDIWGDGKQTRSFLYIDECVEGITRLMRSDCKLVLNIGSEEMVSINTLAKMVIEISGKELSINNIKGPEGVRGRNSNNDLIKKELNWAPNYSLEKGLKTLYKWISSIE